ncbi:MAG: AGE family epimerase/isomerase [Thermogutta sp.]
MSVSNWPCAAVCFRAVFAFSAMLAPALTCYSLAEQSQWSSPTPNDYKRSAEEIETHFENEILPFWFPRCLDHEHGGFRSQFLSDGTLGKDNAKTIVFQARMTWLAAEVAQRYPQLAETYRDYARHGLAFLRKVMWDHEHDGFYWGLDENGHFVPAYGQEKHLYGISFGLYAAANVYRATGDADALELAQATFRWLEKHARDRQSGGYFEAFARDGTPITEGASASSGRQNAQRDLLGTPYGFKSMNSHIHILEALTELHRAWPSEQVTERLHEIFLIVRDKIAVEPGCLNLYFTPDWRPVPDHDSFGHDVETAFLLLEAAERLHLANDPTTIRVAKSLVDHALQYGWDDRLGGFYDKGTAFGPAYGLEKIWWTQAEGLNALLLMHELFGTEDQRYWPAFVKQWQYIQRYQINAKAGEWYDTVSAEGKPITKDLGHIWKAAYHNGRALMECAARLRRLAENAPKN